MNYTKPEITSLGSANSAIQGGMSKTAVNRDSSEGSILHTPPAYEADE